MGGVEMTDRGDWIVDAEDDLVSLSLSEISEEDGVFSHKIYLPPDIARKLGVALIDFAGIAEGNE